MMKAPEAADPMNTSQMLSRWIRGESTFQPKTHNPRNVDSRKNAASPSIARGAPNTSPTKREYADQFMPNSNSWTRPVTTPTAMLISSRVPKKRVSRLSESLPDLNQDVCSSATRKERPIVTGTNRKW